LSKFWDGKQGKAEQGLEISTLAVVDYYTAYHVSTCQTSPEPKEGETRVHEYVSHFQKDCYAQSENVRYVVTENYHTKRLITQVILENGFDRIGKMRSNTNLHYLYTGEQKPKARRRYLYRCRQLNLLSLAVPSKLWLAAARTLTDSEPIHNQFFPICYML
jgi:hypothetical protein